jgi:hypothetical protein
MSAPTSDYRVEKLRRRLRIVLKDGSRLEGDVFLRPVSRYRSRPEEPSDLLNDAEPFFAFVSDDDAVLVAKTNVARAEIPVQANEDPDVQHVLGVAVEVKLTDGSVCTGNIFLETRSDRPRLLDFLNTYHARFLPVVDAQQIVLVNTDLIAHVREVD